MKQVELVYLACPFRHPDQSVQKKRCAAAHYTTAQLSLQGFHVFSPLTHNEILMELAREISGEHWMQFDLAILSNCKRLFVLTLEGWEQSRGVQIEIDFAKKLGIPIKEIAPPEDAKFHHLIRQAL